MDDSLVAGDTFTFAIGFRDLLEISDSRYSQGGTMGIGVQITVASTAATYPVAKGAKVNKDGSG